jgi:catechol 2,3-dioxygenase-like lactoylglutathione lyase family enzyme
MNDISLMTMNEPIFDVAQLAHVELLTPDLEGTLHFFKDLLGMQETERRAQSVYLRGYEEQYHHSLKVTAAPRAGLGHVAWRARSPQALERRVAAIEATGLGRGWIDGDVGHGRAYRFDTPEGHPMELLWDVDYVTASAGKETPLRNRPQKRPRNGVPVRRIDHLNLLVANAGAVRDFLVDILGFRERERVVSDDDGSVVASFLSVTNLSHDIAIVPEPTDMRGRFHHAAPLRRGGTGKGSRHRDRTRTRPAWHRRGVISLHAGAGGQSHRAHGRSRLHDFRSGLEDRGLEGIRDPHCRRYLDRLAVAGLILELRNAAGGRAARHPESVRCLIETESA